MDKDKDKPGIMDRLRLGFGSKSKKEEPQPYPRMFNPVGSVSHTPGYNRSSNDGPDMVDAASMARNPSAPPTGFATAPAFGRSPIVLRTGTFNTPGSTPGTNHPHNPFSQEPTSRGLNPSPPPSQQRSVPLARASKDSTQESKPQTPTHQRTDFSPYTVPQASFNHMPVSNGHGPTSRDMSVNGAEQPAHLQRGLSGIAPNSRDSAAPGGGGSPYAVAQKPRTTPLIRCNAGRYIVSQVGNSANVGPTFKCISTAVLVPELTPEQVLRDSGVYWDDPDHKPPPASPANQDDQDAALLAQIQSRALRAKERLEMEAQYGPLPEGSHSGVYDSVRHSLVRGSFAQVGSVRNPLYSPSARVAGMDPTGAPLRSRLSSVRHAGVHMQAAGHSQRYRLATVPATSSQRHSLVRMRTSSERRKGRASSRLHDASGVLPTRHSDQTQPATAHATTSEVASPGRFNPNSPRLPGVSTSGVVGDLALPQLAIPEMGESGVEATPSDRADHTATSSPFAAPSNANLSSADESEGHAGRHTGHARWKAPGKSHLGLAIPNGDGPPRTSGLPAALVPADSEEAHQAAVDKAGQKAEGRKLRIESMPSSPSGSAGASPKKRIGSVQHRPAPLPQSQSASGAYMQASSLGPRHSSRRPPLPASASHYHRPGVMPDISSLRRYQGVDAPPSLLQRPLYSMRRTQHGHGDTSSPAGMMQAASSRRQSIRYAVDVGLAQIGSRRASKRISGMGMKLGGLGLGLDLDTCHQQGIWSTQGFVPVQPRGEEDLVFIPPDLQQLNDEDLKKVRKLGQGQFGSVHLALWCGVEVAMKELHHVSMTDQEQEQVFWEAQRLAMLRHPCVIAFYGIVTTSPDAYCTVVEYCPTGNLVHGLKWLKAQGPVSRSTKAAIALQAARGMEYLHSKGVVHFDLKGENLLCDLRDLSKPVVKIGDLGLSIVKEDKDGKAVKGKMKGTLPWMAPELFPGWTLPTSRGAKQRGLAQPERMPWDDTPKGEDGVKTREAPWEAEAAADGAESEEWRWETDTDMESALDDEHVTEAVDVYSFGIVLWEIWTLGDTPYENAERSELIAGIMDGRVRPDIPQDCDPKWAQLMKECWAANPKKRPSFTKVSATLQTMIEPYVPPRPVAQQGANQGPVRGVPAVLGAVDDLSKASAEEEAQLALDLAKAQAEEIASVHSHRLPWGAHIAAIAEGDGEEDGSSMRRSARINSMGRSSRKGSRIALRNGSLKPGTEYSPKDSPAAPRLAGMVAQDGPPLVELPTKISGGGGAGLQGRKSGPGSGSGGGAPPPRLTVAENFPSMAADNHMLSPIPASPAGWAESSSPGMTDSRTSSGATAVQAPPQLAFKSRAPKLNLNAPNGTNGH